MYGGVNGTDFLPTYLKLERQGKEIADEDREHDYQTAEGRYIYRLWETLQHSRNHDFGVPERLKATEIEAELRMIEVKPNYWLLHLLRQVDGLWLEAWAKAHSPKKK